MAPSDSRQKHLLLVDVSLESNLSGHLLKRPEGQKLLVWWEMVESQIALRLELLTEELAFQ